MPQSTTLEEAITAALARRDDEEAAALLAAAFGVEAGTTPLPELLEELAEYYTTGGRHDEAVAVMTMALQRGWAGTSDGRCRIAEFLLQAGLLDEAESLYDAVVETAPDDAAPRYAAAVELWQANQPARALRWAAEGLRLALEQHPGPMLTALADLHGQIRQALGEAPDSLDARATRQLSGPRGGGPARGEGTTPPLPFPVDARAHDLAVPFLPGRHFEAAVAAWPDLARRWAAGGHAGYRTEVERRLRELAQASPQTRVGIVALDPGVVAAWCARHGMDAREAFCRDAYAANALNAGRSRAWPPARDEPCWCGADDPYGQCCGAPTDT